MKFERLSYINIVKFCVFDMFGLLIWLFNVIIWIFGWLVYLILVREFDWVIKRVKYDLFEIDEVLGGFRSFII